MPLPEALRLRDADAADLPRIAALREAVGWSVHDWALRAVLDPPRARCLVAVNPAGQVVGVGSGIAYGALGFVGNMIVDARYRRRGLGSAILVAVIEFLAELGVVRFELFATAEGRTLYARHAFEAAGRSAMVRVHRGIEAPDLGITVSAASPEEQDELASFDAPRFGGDRVRLLRGMLADQSRPLMLARLGGEVVGYAWLRPDGERVGPLVADSPEAAVTLLAEAFVRMPGAEVIGLNLPAGNRLGAQRLAELGAAIEPWDGRMARGPQVPRRDEAIYGNTVGALG